MIRVTWTVHRTLRRAAAWSAMMRYVTMLLIGETMTMIVVTTIPAVLHAKV